MLNQLAQVLLGHYRRRGRLLLLFDYDGTLVPIVEYPWLATLPAESRCLLRRLLLVPRVSIGVLSGRGLDDLRSMVDLRGVALAGTSGLEIEISGIPERHPRLAECLPVLSLLAQELGRELNFFPGAWLERKPVGLTVHYRALPAVHSAELHCHVAAAIAATGTALRIVDGHRSLEITPDVDWDKGTAVRRMLAALAPGGALTLYAGDGPNDSAAFDAVTEMEGITIGIGREAPESTEYRLPGPAELHVLLSTLAQALGAVGPKAPKRAASREE